MSLQTEQPAGTAKSISLIVPVFNEEAAISRFVEELDVALSDISNNYRFDLIFVNDGSSDSTEVEIKRISDIRPNVTLINLSRNFGKEAALSAGILHARGDAVIPIDVDLQDPPSIIPAMIDRWESGAQVVNARRVERKTDSWLKRESARAFYRVFNLLADLPIPDNVGDFRLLDRAVVDVICELGERSRFNKALFSWVGFATDEVPYERQAREAGHSAWSYWKLWKLALDGIFSSSTAPLRIWTYFGLIVFFASCIYTLSILFRTIILGVVTPGYASTVILILTFGGLNMLALGIIGEYIGRTFTEVRQRPLFVVRSIVTSDKDGH